MISLAIEAWRGEDDAPVGPSTSMRIVPGQYVSMFALSIRMLLVAALA
jgi:hypothetical protein